MGMMISRKRSKAAEKPAEEAPKKTAASGRKTAPKKN